MQNSHRPNPTHAFAVRFWRLPDGTMIHAPAGHLVVALNSFALPPPIEDDIPSLLKVSPASVAAPTFMFTAHMSNYEPLPTVALLQRLSL